MTTSTQTRSRTRHKSLESPVPGKRARRVWREAARKRPEFTRNERGTSLGSPPYPCKYDSTVSKMAAKYKATIVTPHGPRVCMQVSSDRDDGRKPLVARFGGIPLKRQKKAVLDDRRPIPATVRPKELISRLRTGRCELCKQRADVQVHHVRKLTDLAKPGQSQSAWAQLMIVKRRKTLIVCAACHESIHARHPTAITTE